MTLTAFIKRFWGLVRQPLFLYLFSFGNSIILIGAVALYYLEYGTNPRIQGFIDTLWWAVATVTTVGYGDVSPITDAGKIMGMLMMLMGTTLFCSFTALFAASLLSANLEEVESEVQSLHSEERLLDSHLASIEKDLMRLKELRTKRKSR